MTAEDARDATEAPATNRRVSVLLPLPLAGAYDYLVPPELDLDPGDFVVAPLGPNEYLGVVGGEAEGALPASRLKPVSERIAAAPLPEVERRFVDWVAHYTMSPPGAVLRMAMSVPAALEAPKTEIVYRATALPDDAPLKLTAARRRVLEQLKEGPALPAT